MSAEHPIILYVGNPERAQHLHQLVIHCGWHIEIGVAALQALALYQFMMPDVVVLDTGLDPITAQEVYLHLLSIEPVPAPRLIVWLADATPRRAEKILPSDAPDVAIIHAIEELVGGKVIWFEDGLPVGTSNYA